MIGMLATSKAGHDCKEVFVIVREEEEYVYLADGKARSLAKPKRKNKKHIQIWKKQTPLVSQIREKLIRGETVRDEEIKRAMKLLVGSELEE